MAERKWTVQQLNAINSRGGTLLLSAAAGSGKTAVLVERIIKLLTQGNEPVQPSELLVVTFTNAAAQEMRMRISAAIDGLIRKEPLNNLYRSIKMKLPEAEICTIDSFCIKLVRENFHTADIEPDFTMISGGEAQMLINQAMSRTLDNICDKTPHIYDMLNSLTSYGRDDSNLSAKILKLYDFSLAHSFPDLWLDSISHMYAPCDNIKDTVWGKIIIEDAVVTVKQAVDLIYNALNDIRYDDVILEKYEAALSNTYSLLESFTNILNTDTWDNIFRFITENPFESLPRAPRGYGDNPVKTAAEFKYKKAKEIYENIAKGFCTDTQGFNDDNDILRPVIAALVSAVKDFSQTYAQLKKEKNSYTFSDTMHKALELIATVENGEIKKSSLAYSLESRYREILIDEYQDTNEAQDMLFRLLSRKEENMFMVGDVKQSIYRFRLAMPEIFVQKSKQFSSYDAVNYPAKIILGKNFRSRKGVLDGINFLFDRIMSEKAGEMDYTAEDALYYGEGYNEDSSSGIELHFLKSDDTACEAGYIAKTINNMIKSHVQVSDKGIMRDARPSDFCILMRSPSNKAEIYADALRKYEIQCSCQNKTGLFDTLEVSVFMSLLKAINNPTDDISMLAVMFSPMYGFTADDVAQLKISNRYMNLYSCLKNCKNDNAKKLLSDLGEYRRMAAIMPFDIFIRTLMDITGYPAVVCAMSEGSIRHTNLMMLCSIASEYAAVSSAGIDGFVRYISRLAEKSSDIPSANDVSESADVVRIYSIHKSKGLEFPFVILADCSKKFNLMDAADDMIISTAAGVGMTVINNDKLQKYSTIAHAASKIAVRNATVSEELRVLYVAMTRAKEKLIAVSSDPNIEDTLANICAQVPFDKKPSAGTVLKAGSYKNWFLMGYLNHPDMHQLLADISVEKFYKKADSPITVVVAEPEEMQDNNTSVSEANADDAIIRILEEKCGYVYPYSIPEDVRPKRVASEFENHIFKPEYFGKTKPSFVLGDKLSAAETGTANHLFLQNLDFSTTDMLAECERMVNAHILSQKQAASVRIDKMEKFSASELFKRIRNADAVYREKEFTVEIALKDTNPDVDDNVKNEKILVLGKADLVFTENGEATVIDWKTDRSKTREEFIAAYSGQLQMYRIAMEQVLGLPIKEMSIYSLELEETITI